MARPERKNVDYFPHYMNHGAKMRYLCNKYGNDGYAVWYKIMERLASADNHHINLSDDIQITFLADYCNVSEGILYEIIEFLVKAKWLHEKLWNDHKIICSGEFIESIADAYKRRNNSCINIQAVELMYYNNPQAEQLLPNKKPQSKVEYSKVNREITRAREFCREMYEDEQWQISVRQVYPRLRKADNITKALNHFVSFCESSDVAHKDLKDAKGHFIRWMKHQSNTDIPGMK